MEYGFNKSAINRCEEEVLCGERCGDEGLNRYPIINGGIGRYDRCSGSGYNNQPSGYCILICNNQRINVGEELDRMIVGYS